MDCKLCREHIEDYLEKKLSPQARKAFSRHLEQCPDCRREVSQTIQLNRLLDEWQVPALVDVFDQRWQMYQAARYRSWWKKMLAWFTGKA